MKKTTTDSENWKSKLKTEGPSIATKPSGVREPSGNSKASGKQPSKRTAKNGAVYTGAMYVKVDPATDKRKTKNRVKDKFSAAVKRHNSPVWDKALLRVREILPTALSGCMSAWGE